MSRTFDPPTHRMCATYSVFFCYSPMSPRRTEEPPRGAAPPAKLFRPDLDGLKKTIVDFKALRACQILAKEVAKRKPKQTTATQRTATRPAPVSRQAKPTPSKASPPMQAEKKPVPAENPVPLQPTPATGPSAVWSTEQMVAAIKIHPVASDWPPELVEALRALRPPENPSGPIRHRLVATDGSKVRVWLPLAKELNI